MSGGELLLTSLVALLVFGPNRLPTLARQLGYWFAYFNRYKQQLQNWLEQQQQQLTLQNNLKKADDADKQYLNADD